MSLFLWKNNDPLLMLVRLSFDFFFFSNNLFLVHVHFNEVIAIIEFN